MGNKTKFGNWEVGDYGINFFVGWCSLEDEDIENFRKALKEYDKRQNKKDTKVRSEEQDE